MVSDEKLSEQLQCLESLKIKPLCDVFLTVTVTVTVTITVKVQKLPESFFWHLDRGTALPCRAP